MAEGRDDELVRRIRSTASRLFSELGYDGTDIEMIADALGLKPEIIRELTGGKKAIYLQIMDDQISDYRARTASALSVFTPDAAGINRLLDAYFDYCLSRPQVQAMWLQRCLGDAADITDIESRYLSPLAMQLGGPLKSAFKPGVDVHLAMWTAVWSIHCFLTGGATVEGGARLSGDSPASRHRFLKHLHGYIAALANP